MHPIAQVFSAKKMVDSPALNRLGVQPLRAVGTRARYRVRRAPDDPVVQALAAQGFATIENFLPDDVFAATCAEVERYIDGRFPTLLHSLGTTTLSQYYLASLDPQGFPHLEAWRRNARVLQMGAGAERRPVGPASGGVLIEDITIGDYSTPDEQTRLHVDSVFHTDKVWLYLTDVTEENAPLVYVPRSHRLDAVRLRAEYRDSVDPNRCIDPSRRVPDAEMQHRGLAPRVVTCPRNTLVIADTSGYHARAIGRDGGHRRALYMFFRSNPFRYPWPRARRTLGSVRRAVVGGRSG
jgi:hypothetical protein